jgi:non-heme chloroperoxidase
VGTPAVKSIALSSGVTLHYVEQGDRSGVPVLFLHGFTDCWRSFELVLPHVPASIRAVALTQRGHGDAHRPAAGYRTRDFASDVAEVVEQLGLAPAVVVGHSMGATNAERFAIDHPARTRGLVLAAGFASYRRNPAVMEFWQSGVSQLADPIDPVFVRGFQESTLAQPVPPAFVDMVVQESLKVPARVWREAFEGFLEDDVDRDPHRHGSDARPVGRAGRARDPGRSGCPRVRGQEFAAGRVRAGRTRAALGRARALRGGRRWIRGEPGRQRGAMRRKSR